MWDRGGGGLGGCHHSWNHGCCVGEKWSSSLIGCVGASLFAEFGFGVVIQVAWPHAGEYVVHNDLLSVVSAIGSVDMIPMRIARALTLLM